MYSEQASYAENDELKQWLTSFQETNWMTSHLFWPLRANQFSSRLKIKLIGDEQLGLIFPTMSLGTKALLKYQNMIAQR